MRRSLQAAVLGAAVCVSGLPVAADDSDPVGDPRSWSPLVAGVAAGGLALLILLAADGTN